MFNFINLRDLHSRVSIDQRPRLSSLSVLLAIASIMVCPISRAEQGGASTGGGTGIIDSSGRQVTMVDVRRITEPSLQGIPSSVVSPEIQAILESTSDPEHAKAAILEKVVGRIEKLSPAFYEKLKVAVEKLKFLWAKNPPLQLAGDQGALKLRDGEALVQVAYRDGDLVFQDHDQYDRMDGLNRAAEVAHEWFHSFSGTANAVGAQHLVAFWLSARADRMTSEEFIGILPQFLGLSYLGESDPMRAFKDRLGTEIASFDGKGARCGYFRGFREDGRNKVAVELGMRPKKAYKDILFLDMVTYGRPEVSLESEFIKLKDQMEADRLRAALDNDAVFAALYPSAVYGKVSHLSRDTEICIKDGRVRAVIIRPYTLWTRNKMTRSELFERISPTLDEIGQTTADYEKDRARKQRCEEIRKALTDELASIGPSEERRLRGEWLRLDCSGSRAREREEYQQYHLRASQTVAFGDNVFARQDLEPVLLTWPDRKK